MLKALFQAFPDTFLRPVILAEIAQTQAVIDKTKALLANEAFVSRAPQKLVDNEREKLANAVEKLEKLNDKLAMFDN